MAIGANAYITLLIFILPTDRHILAYGSGVWGLAPAKLQNRATPLDEAEGPKIKARNS